MLVTGRSTARKAGHRPLDLDDSADVGVAGADEPANGGVGEIRSAGYLAEGNALGGDSRPQALGDGSDGAHGVVEYAGFFARSSARILPRAGCRAERYTSGMATFRDIIASLAKACGSKRKLAFLGGVSDSTIRDWLTKEEPETGSAIPGFAKRMKLTHAQVLGFEPIPPAYYARLRYGAVSDDEVIRQRAIALLSKGPLTDAQKALARRLVATTEEEAG